MNRPQDVNRPQDMIRDIVCTYAHAKGPHQHCFPVFEKSHLLLDSTLWGSYGQWTHVSGGLTPGMYSTEPNRARLLGSHNISMCNHNLKKVMRKPTDPLRRQSDKIQLVRYLRRYLISYRTGQWTHTGHTALALHEHTNFDIHILGEHFAIFLRMATCLHLFA